MLSSIRMFGVNLLVEKKIFVSLTGIYGIGVKTAKKICIATGIDCEKRAKELSDADIDKIRDYISKNFTVEGDLRGQIAQNIKMKISIGCYEGARHRLKLPVRGQRTKTNSRTRKGHGKAIANKKVVSKT